MSVHRTTLHRPRPRCAPTARAAALLTRGARGLTSRLGSERGDVPGWVLITLMTAAIVVALWAVASDQIVAIFENAMAPFLGREL